MPTDQLLLYASNSSIIISSFIRLLYAKSLYSITVRIKKLPLLVERAGTSRFKFSINTFMNESGGHPATLPRKKTNSKIRRSRTSCRKSDGKRLSVKSLYMG